MASYRTLGSEIGSVASQSLNYHRIIQTAINACAKRLFCVAEVAASTNGQQASGLPRHRCGLVGSYIGRNGKMLLPDQDGRSA